MLSRQNNFFLLHKRATPTQGYKRCTLYDKRDSHMRCSGRIMVLIFSGSDHRRRGKNGKTLPAGRMIALAVCRQRVSTGTRKQKGGSSVADSDGTENGKLSHLAMARKRAALRAKLEERNF